jgi:UDPglucose 6-dehydrogenase
MDIAVIGVGYVGLVTGAVFAELGNSVVCTDKNADKIAMLQRLEMPFYEPGLTEIVTRNVEDNRLRFSTDIGAAVRASEIVFIAVGTPPKETGETDLSQVEAAAAEIGRNLDNYKIVVNKSTVPVGTGDLVKEIIEHVKPANVPCDVVSDALSPDRIVIGAPNKKVAMKLIELYSTLEKPMVITSVRSAEIIKYASNAFLATKISFINSIANLCEKVGADIEEVVRGVGLDQRIGSRFLRPGIGYGGSCFPKDSESLLNVSRRYGAEIEIIRTTIEVNKRQAQRFVAKVLAAVPDIKNTVIGALGLSFKPGTDDLRESVAINIIRQLKAKGARIQAYDPMAMEKCKKEVPDIAYCVDEYAAAAGAAALLVLTEWNRFRQLDFQKLRSVMSGPYLFDGRNIYDPAVVRRFGFIYEGVGRAADENVKK